MMRAPYSAAGFNAGIEWLRRWFPLAGRDVEFDYVPGQGIRVHASDELLGFHEWQVRCFTAEAGEGTGTIEWRAHITPGFVNGRDVSIVAKDVPSALTDDPRPSLKLSGWRNPLSPGEVRASADGNRLLAAAGDGYPPFFNQLGVALPAPGGDAFQDTSLQSPDEPNRTRQIRALDIVLTVPRISASQQVTLRSGTAGDPQIVEIQTVFTNTAVRNAVAPFRLQTFSKWEAPVQPSPFELLAGTASDPQTDELRIATVWMVSPPDADPLADPDPTWTPYPQHFVFRNLNYATRNKVPDAPQTPIRLQTGLLGGSADQIFASLLSPLNDQYATLNAYLGAANFAGEFWT